MTPSLPPSPLLPSLPSGEDTMTKEEYTKMKQELEGLV